MNTSDSQEPVRPTTEGSKRYLAKPVFLFTNYRDFLLEWLNAEKDAKGIRTRLAEAACCQPSYLSQVLSGNASLSLDQLHGVSRYLNLCPDEWEYLRELAIQDKAATPKLKADCDSRLTALRERLGGAVAVFSDTVATPSRDDMLWYSQSWQHGAVFVSLSSESDRTAAEIAAQLQIPPLRTAQICDELVKRQFVKKSTNGYRAVAPVLYWQHGAIYHSSRMNWMNHGHHRSMDGYDRGLHISGLTSMTKADFLRFRDEIKTDHKNRMRGWAESAKNGGDSVVFFGIDLFEA